MQHHRPFALLGALVALVYLAGWFDPLERTLSDLRAGLVERPASGDLVIVAIDPASLQALERWPWPRRYHAEAIRRLLAAGAARIAYDVDLSAASQPQDDRALAAALADAGPERIVLPVFRHLRQTADNRIEPVDTAPLPLFGDHAGAVSVDLRADGDGRVRRIARGASRQGEELPTAPAWLQRDPGGAADGAGSGAPILIDYSIDPDSIPQLSFIDLLSGRFDAAALAGKRVLVGATAIELGDWISVPRHWALPRPVVQALAFETLRQDRALAHAGGWPMALASALLVMLVGPLFVRLPWRHGLAVLAGLIAAVIGLALLLQPWAAVVLDSTAPVLGLLLAFAGAMLGKAERRSRRRGGQPGLLPIDGRLTRELVDSSFDAIVTFDPGGVLLSCNGAAERMFGRPAAELVSQPVTRVLPDEHHRALAAWAQDGGSRELVAARRDGSRIPVDVALSRMQLDGRWVGIAILRDISQRKAQHAELERMALHDALTGLPNRTLLNDRIAQAISASRRSGEAMAVLMLDLDRFKEVNDTLGHLVGDRLLTLIGPRLRRPLRDTDTVARLGGDEFAILLPGPTDVPAACGIAERIVEAFRRPFAIDDMALEVGISAGVALYPEHGEAAEPLLQHADAAMYAAKRGGSGFVVYDAESEDNRALQLSLTGELRRAIEDGQLSLGFQPKVDAREGTLAGVEALLRWHHPRHGLIAPEDFVPGAEHTGLIRPLTLWVVETVLREQRTWRETGFEINVAVNLSVKSLHDPELTDVLRLSLERWQTDPRALTLELTESALMANPDNSMAVLKRVADLGCRLSLDDFGTGYSSLACLQRLPIDELKIDRSFVAAMTEDDNAAVVVRSVIKLAKSLGLTVIAEGVESEDAFASLRALGCDQMQGFYVGQAMPSDALLAWLRESPWDPDAQQSRDRLQPA
ncbi:MAG TPA: EAL domain-containing protein [Geminicoccaceae bacterium]|nr:EAL domain-containing protein [Geminicoccaceae bacterium]